MAKQEIVLVPIPAAGHMVSAVEFAKLLIHRTGGDNRFAVTILLLNSPHEPQAVCQFSHLAASHPEIRFIQLPHVDLPSLELTDSIEKFVSVFNESHKSLVKDAIIKNVANVAGIIVDMFCTSMIDVANELGVPSYVFFTSGASLLGFLLYLPIHKSITGKEFFTASDPDSLIIPSFSKPVPSRFLPSYALNRDGCSSFLSHARKFKEAKGIIINTFAELEAYAIKSLESELETTKVYPIGPLIKKVEKGKSDQKIVSWLDEQPSSSVIYLCFGSNAGLHPTQLAEIATALENSGLRFLWAIQKPPTKDFSPSSREYNDFSDVLPDGFLEKTKNRGLMCGWAPQVEVLSHKAVGGFVSHCGWNSILESIWNGVPIAAWPLFAEQQLNAFQLVNELGIAVEVKLDYRIDNADMMVSHDEIEKAITSLMNTDNPVRKKMKELSDVSRQAWLEGGSSFNSMERFAADIVDNPL